MIKRSLLACALLACAPARAEEVYFRGLFEVFSVGVCAIGPGRCVSYLSVESIIDDLCTSRPRSVAIAGHSLGASAAIRAVQGLKACGVRVKAAAFLDPMVHPYGIPKGTKTLVIYSPAFAGSGEGHSDATKYPGGHIGLAFDPAIRARVRALFDGAK